MWFQSSMPPISMTRSCSKSRPVVSVSKTISRAWRFLEGYLATRRRGPARNLLGPWGANAADAGGIDRAGQKRGGQDPPGRPGQMVREVPTVCPASSSRPIGAPAQGGLWPSPATGRGSHPPRLRPRPCPCGVDHEIGASALLGVRHLLGEDRLEARLAHAGPGQNPRALISAGALTTTTRSTRASPPVSNRRGMSRTATDAPDARASSTKRASSSRTKG